MSLSHGQPVLSSNWDVYAFPFPLLFSFLIHLLNLNSQIDQKSGAASLRCSSGCSPLSLSLSLVGQWKAPNGPWAWLVSDYTAQQASKHQGSISLSSAERATAAGDGEDRRRRHAESSASAWLGCRCRNVLWAGKEARWTYNNKKKRSTQTYADLAFPYGWVRDSMEIDQPNQVEIIQSIEAKWRKSKEASRGTHGIYKASRNPYPPSTWMCVSIYYGVRT